MRTNDDNIKNLSNSEAIEKLKKLSEDADFCFFVTELNTKPLNGRPMSTADVDENGCIYFFSDRNSDKNQQIEYDNTVQLFYSNKGSAEYLSVYGKAEISTDKELIEKLWNPMVKTWFQGGKDDPDITVIKVIPEDAYYWDTKHNKMVSLIKMLTSVITGKTMDDSVEGKLNP
ncbi:MAG: pyridoxamine 5'-phosphate oxidase family protein [Fimbriimonadaceae bacterium]|nr:pyridoxamine 5'-phosphate oxidase family protein [Chitinophagales bacterium]